MDYGEIMARVAGEILARTLLVATDEKLRRSRLQRHGDESLSRRKK
jgi:hypothetical protein